MSDTPSWSHSTTTSNQAPLRPTRLDTSLPLGTPSPARLTATSSQGQGPSPPMKLSAIAYAKPADSHAIDPIFEHLVAAGEATKDDATTLVDLSSFPDSGEEHDLGLLLDALAKGRGVTASALKLAQYIPHQVIEVRLASVGHKSLAFNIATLVFHAMASLVPRIVMRGRAGLYDLPNNAGAKEPDLALAPVPLGQRECISDFTIVGECGWDSSHGEALRDVRIMASRRHDQQPIRMGIALSFSRPTPSAPRQVFVLDILVPSEDAPHYSHPRFTPALAPGTTTEWPEENLTLVRRIAWTVDPTNLNDVTESLVLPVRFLVAPEDRNNRLLANLNLTISADKLHDLGVDAFNSSNAQQRGGRMPFM